MDFNTDVVYSKTSDMTSVSNSGRSEVKEKKTVKTAPSDGFGGNFSIIILARITKLYTLIGTISLTNMPDMTSLVASGRLQNAITYCAKVCKSGPDGQRVQ